MFLSFLHEVASEPSVVFLACLVIGVGSNASPACTFSAQCQGVSALSLCSARVPQPFFSYERSVVLVCTSGWSSYGHAP